MLLKTQDTAFTFNELVTLLSTARANMSQAIREANHNYAQRNQWLLPRHQGNTAYVGRYSDHHKLPRQQNYSGPDLAKTFPKISDKSGKQIWPSLFLQTSNMNLGHSWVSATFNFITFNPHQAQTHDSFSCVIQMWHKISYSEINTDPAQDIKPLLIQGRCGSDPVALLAYEY